LSTWCCICWSSSICVYRTSKGIWITFNTSTSCSRTISCRCNCSWCKTLT